MDSQDIQSWDGEGKAHTENDLQIHALRHSSGQNHVRSFIEYEVDIYV